MDIRGEMVDLLPKLRAFALSLCRDRVRADDLVQAACERGLRAQNSFTPGTQLASWLMRILYNVWIDDFRKTGRETALDLDGLAQIAAEDGRQIVETRSELDAAWRLIAQLPEEQRAVMALVCADGLSYRDAADVLGVPIGTVMSRLSRARLQLSDAMKPAERSEIRLENR